MKCSCGGEIFVHVYEIFKYGVAEDGEPIERDEYSDLMDVNQDIALCSECDKKFPMIDGKVCFS